MVPRSRSLNRYFPQARVRMTVSVGRLLYKFRIIIPSRTGAVTASHQEEVTDSTASLQLPPPDRPHRRTVPWPNPVSDGIAAVDAGKCLIFGISTELQSLFNHRSEIFFRFSSMWTAFLGKSTSPVVNTRSA